MQLVQEDSIRRLLVIPVHLEVERNAIPSGGSGMLSEVTVDRLGDAIERNRLVEDPVVRGPLYLNDHVIPGVVRWIAGDPGAHPPVVHVVPDIPFMSAGDAALVAKNESFSVEILADVKLQNL